jgi:chitodextrinase
VTGYRVYRNGSQIATTTTPTYSETGLAASTTYIHTVAAHDTPGNVSAQSGQLVLTTTSTAINTLNPVDVAAAASGTSGGLNSGTVTTTQPTDLIFGAGVSDNPET